ncbi:MAG: tripartite tricarboxylate transporter substrate binding protein [Alphaproteobacteria bacterium]
MKRLATVALISASGLIAEPVFAEDWPNRPMTMVAPFGAGGTTDAIARIVADGLSAQLHQPVIVENVGGAGGMTGTNRVAKGPADGYQFVLGNVGTHAQNQSLYKKPLYNALTDFAPVALITDQSLVLVVRKDFPANNLQEFIAYTKANQSKMQYSSAGLGGSNHLACEILNSAIGVHVTHVPYRSGGQAMQDLLAGRVDYQCPSLPTAMPQVAGQLIKAIAVLSKHRSPSMPDLATAHEQGLTDFDVPSWYALFLPRRTPGAIVQKLQSAALAAMDTPSMQERLHMVGSDLVIPERRSSEYLAKFVEDEIKKWEGPIKSIGVQF